MNELDREKYEVKRKKKMQEKYLNMSEFFFFCLGLGKFRCV